MLNRYLPLVLLCIAGVLGAEPKRDRFGDPLPEGAIARLGSLRLRHHSSVRIGDFTTDGKLLAAFSGGNFIHFWDVASGREVRRVPAGRLFQPRWFRLSTDGKSLILADRDGEYRIIDAVTGAERLKLEPRKLDRRYLDVHALAVSRDGKTAVTIYYPDILVVWDLTGGKRLGEYPCRNNLNRFANQPIALTPNGKHLVVPHMDGSLHLLEARSGKEIFAFEMPSDKPRKDSPMVTISPDGRYLAFGGSSTRASESPCNSVTLCDMRTGKRVRELSSKPPIHEWGFTPDSRSLAVSDEETIRIFDVPSGKETKTLRKPSGSGGLVFSPDGRTLAAAWGTCILLWDVVAGRFLHSPIGHSWFLRQIHFFPDGKRLVSHTSMRGEMIVWDLATSQPVAMHPSGELQHWIVVADNGEEIYFLPSKQRLTQGETPEMRFDAKRNANGKSQRITEPDNLEIYCWGWETDRVQQQIAAKNSKVYDAFVRSPNGRQGQAYSGITYSADGRCVAMHDTRLCIRELASGQDRIQFAQTGRFDPLTFSPDGRFLAGYDRGRNTLIYSTLTGKLVAKYAANRSNVTAVAFSPDSRLLATGGYDGTILLWTIPESDGLPAVVKQEETVALWQALAGDAIRANRALAGLAAAPAQAVPLIRQRFRTDRKKPDAKRVARLIAELDDDAFKVRERATRELAEAGSDAADALRQALANNPSVETKKRLEDLLTRLSKSGDPKRLRSLRAIEVLERINTPESIDVLRELARQSLPAELHEDIEGSLRRLEKRTP